MADDKKNPSFPTLEISEVMKGMPKAAEGMKKAKDLIDGLASLSGITQGGGAKKAALAKASLDATVYLTDSYFKGKREAVEFENAKLASGNPAGYTTDQLRDLAFRIKGSEGTVGQASEVLAALVATGKVQRSVMLEVATATSELNRLKGVPISESVAKFDALGREPTKKSIEYNRDGRRYLSDKQLQRISQLEAEGNVLAAGELAQKAFALDQTQLVQQQAANRILPDRLLSSATDFAKRLDDSARELGRPRTLQQKIDWEKELLEIQRGGGASKGGKSSGGPFVGKPRVSIEERVQRIEALEELQRLDRRAGDAQAERNARDGKAFDAVAEEWENRDHAKKPERTTEDIAAKRSTAKGATRTAPASPTGIQRAASDGLRPCIEAICCDCKAGTADSSKQGLHKSQASESQRAAGEGVAQTQADVEQKRQKELIETMRKATSSVDDQTTALEAQNLAHGKTKSAVQELNIAQLERQYQDLDNTEKVIPGYLDALGARIDAEKRLLTVTRNAEGIETADKEKKKNDDKAKKMSDDIGGAFREGFVNLLEGKDNALDKLGESLKKKITASVADALYDATLKPAVEAFSSWLPGAFKGIFSGGSGGGSTGSSSGSGGSWFSSLLSGVMGIFGFASAKGNVFASPGLHAYANSVVSQPTFFPFASGIGLMGEAGPEAIMPLRRGADGRLGVSAPGGGGNAVPTIQFAPSNVFHIDARSDRGAVMADMQRLLAENNRGQMEQLKRVKVLPQ